MKMPFSPRQIPTCRLETSHSVADISQQNAKEHQLSATVQCESTLSDNEKCFQEIANGDPNLLKKLKIIEFEVALLRERYSRIPATLKIEHWKHLLSLNSLFTKTKYLDFLFQTAKRKENQKKRKEIRRMEYENLKQVQPVVENYMNYGLQYNSLFIRIYDQTLQKLSNLRLASASLFSQHIVFDCSYESYMSDLNIKFCAKQLVHGYSFNRLHHSPFHVKYCNFNQNSTLFKYLDKLLIQNITKLDITEKSYLEVYPKDKIVYLSPHATDVVHKFDKDVVYVIGAYVDRGCGKKISLGKAKEANVRMAKLPIDHYIDWQKGGKSLPINIVLSILLDARYHGNWSKALRENLPSRCITRYERD